MLVVVIIGIMIFASIPDEETKINFDIPDSTNSKVIVGDKEFLIPDDSVENIIIFDQLTLQNPDLILPINEEEPMTILNEIQYSFDEVNTVDVVINEYDLVRTITFNDGSIDTKKTSTKLQSLDLVSIDDIQKEVGNGKVKFELIIPVDKKVKSSESKFSFYLIDLEDDTKIKDVKTVFNKMTESDVIDNTLIMLNDETNMSSLLSGSDFGNYEFKVVLDEMFIVYDDNSKEYANANTIYSTSIVKSDSQTFIENEDGISVKSFDFDVPISISSNTQNVSASICLSKCQWGGCCSKSTTSTVIPAPAMGAVTIKNVSTGEIVAEMGAVANGSCRVDPDSWVFGNQSFCASASNARNLTGGSSLAMSGQRGESYEINVSDPNKSWIIDVPLVGGEFRYSCVADQGTKSGSTSGRTCNFP